MLVSRGNRSRSGVRKAQNSRSLGLIAGSFEILTSSDLSSPASAHSRSTGALLPAHHQSSHAPSIAPAPSGVAFPVRRSASQAGLPRAYPPSVAHPALGAQNRGDIGLSHRRFRSSDSIHMRMAAISASLSRAPFAGILPVATKVISRLSLGLPATIAPPDFPPRRISSGVSKDNPPLRIFPLWQTKHLARKTGSASASNVPAASAEAEDNCHRQNEVGQFWPFVHGNTKFIRNRISLERGGAH